MIPETAGPSQRPHRYRLYLDESGDHTYNLLDDPTHRFLALLGVWFRQEDDYKNFSESLESFKKDIFGFRPDKPVVLHRTDIINKKGAFGVLKDPTVEAEFNRRLLEIISRANYRMICVIIDKKRHKEQYSDPFHPYHYCLANVLDRYSGWLKYKNAVGDVMAESRGREEDIQLKGAYRSVYDSGTLMFDRHHHQDALTSKEIKIQPKFRNIPGLQLADVLAHPVKTGCLVEKELVPGLGNSFGKSLWELTQQKFNRNDSRNLVWGYGKVLLPK